MNLEGAREHLAEMLDAVGIRAVTDPRKILAPCALIEPPSTVTIGTMKAETATCQMIVTLIAPANDPSWLMENVVLAMAALGATEAHTATFFMGEDAQLPAYTIESTVTVKES